MIGFCVDTLHYGIAIKEGWHCYFFQKISLIKIQHAPKSREYDKQTGLKGDASEFFVNSYVKYICWGYWVFSCIVQNDMIKY